VATATIDGPTFQVDNVALTLGTEDPAFFLIQGGDAAHRDEDYLPGLSGGLALYGDLPTDVRTPADLRGRELPFEFSGDGDDFNLCFVGSNGLLSVERGTVRFSAADDRTVTFAFSGDFVRHDGEGGESPGGTASGSGTARLSEE
jgi:hypothetical protein